MIEFALATYLLTRPTVTALVETRITAVRSPQTSSQNKSQSRIVYKLYDGSVRHYHAGGASGLVEAEIELMMFARTYGVARDIYEAVRNEIDGFSGTWDSTVIDNAVLSPPATASSDPVQGGDAGHPAVRGVVSVFYQESIPVPVDP